MDHPIAVYILIPIISALIGWLTNYIAVKMIFRPHRAINVLGFKIQGLMPRRQSDLAQRIGETVESLLLTHKDIRDGLSAPEVHAEMEQVIDAQVETFFREKLGSNPMVSMFLQGDVAQNIKQMLSRQLKDALPDFLDRIMGSVQEHVDLKAIVQKRIEEYDLVTLESIVFHIASRELRLIVILGGALGFVVGLGQVGILWVLG